MYDLLLWIYVVNAVILIDHEIDSGYWQEWKLIDPAQEDGIGPFLLLHLPMLFVVLTGLVLLARQAFAGLIISALLGLSGLFAFGFHTYHLRKGKPQFDAPVSKGLLFATLAVSIVQLGVTAVSMLRA